MPNRLNDHTVVANDIEKSFLIAGGFTFTNYPYGEPQKYVEIYTDITCPGVGIIPVMADKGVINVYPNPSSGKIRFDIAVDNGNSLSANVYNIQGQQVFAKTLFCNQREIDLNLPAGMYVLRVIANDRVHSKLITIQ
jgi:hypothetical protein